MSCCFVCGWSSTCVQAKHGCGRAQVVGTVETGDRRRVAQGCGSRAGGAEQEQQGRRCERQSGARAGQCLHELTARRPWQSACLAVALRAAAAAVWAASAAAAAVAAKAPQAPPRGSTQTSKHLTSVGQPAALCRSDQTKISGGRIQAALTAATASLHSAAGA